MSEPREWIPPHCFDCQASIKPQIVTQNTNGNLGRKFIACKGVPETHNFFRWILHDLETGLVSILGSAPVSAPGAPKYSGPCPIPDCTNQSRNVNPKCENFACSVDCRQLFGGCKIHPMPLSLLPPPPSPPPVPSAVSSTPSSSSASVSSQSQPSTQPTPSTSTSTQLTKSASHPTYASQMRPAVAARLAKEKEALKRKQELEEQRVANRLKEEGTVFIASWHFDHIMPTDLTLQPTQTTTFYTYPFIKFTAELLELLGLEGHTVFYLFYPKRQEWTLILEGFVYNVKELGKHVFLRAKTVEVAHCYHIDIYLSQLKNVLTTTPATPNIRTNLAYNRAAIKARKDEDLIASAPPPATPLFRYSPSPFSDVASPPVRLVTPIKRRRETPSPPRRLAAGQLLLTTIAELDATGPEVVDITPRAAKRIASSPTLPRADFPNGFHFSFVHDLLVQCGALKKASERQAVYSEFGAGTYNSKRFSEYKQRWGKATEEQKERYKRAGPEGTWLAFTKEVSHPAAAKRAAKRRITREDKKGKARASSTLEEEDDDNEEQGSDNPVTTL